MSEMVERVARALCDDADEDENEDLGSGLVRWQTYTGAARAAIAAMREPTEAMLSCGLAGYRFGSQNDGEDFAAAAAQCWDAMIDSALTPSPPHQG